MPPIHILGMGNPLLDISSKVDPSMIKKYNLKDNDAILTEDEAIFDEMKNLPIEHIAGGSTQNTIRVSQWIMKPQGNTCYMGCIGKDESGDILQKKVAEDGVEGMYQIHETLPTGKCAVLITGVNRSLVTKLDAANHFSVSHLEEPKNWEVVHNSKICYSAGFFITVSPESMLKVAEFVGKDPSKTYAINLSAPFICSFFKEPLDKVLAYSDIVFCNESEAEAYAEASKWDTKDVTEIAKKISALPKNGKPGRIAIITQGKLPVVVAKTSEEVSSYDVELLKLDQIVDTNGAGDAFAGGFLAQYALGKSLDICVKCGMWAASVIIQRSGCTFPEKMDFTC
ncbi:E2.7.1.20 [Lepeophtheirus salmonis]|uniref:Adenosine kinase n=1 Tax=Lepeophtheirus salmonis TaxID=72036 RepID=D3PK76_LEPSM|nr:Adenosine kinase [Lepeophtheirus salmonis]CAB4065592.1 E2.7.1.20 [Lepeophtheirus salmonis]CAF2959472.1 E2.7.1.20 [Lepeophtheirus salmonis]